MSPTLFLLALSTGFQVPPMQHYSAPLRADIFRAHRHRYGLDKHPPRPVSSKCGFRWDLNAGRPETFFKLRRLDCAAIALRDHRKAPVVTSWSSWGPRVPFVIPEEDTAAESLSATEASWQTPVHGSLLAQSWMRRVGFFKAGASPAHEAVVAGRPLEREQFFRDCGRRTTQLMRDSLGSRTAVSLRHRDEPSEGTCRSVAQDSLSHGRLPGWLRKGVGPSTGPSIS